MTMSERAGYMSPEIMGCQFSIYPLRQAEIGTPIEAAIQAARSEGCTVRVGNLSTLLSGSEDQVFAALRAAFRAAQRSGPSVLTATLAVGMPGDALVGEIQREVDERAGVQTGSVDPGAVSDRGQPSAGGTERSAG